MVTTRRSRSLPRETSGGRVASVSPASGPSKVLELQRQAGNAAVTELVQRSVLEPSVRDQLASTAEAMFEAALSTIDSLLPAAAHLLAASHQGPGMAMGAAGAIEGQLRGASALLDQGLALFKRAGGSISEIPDLLKVRAHLSNAVHFARLTAGGVPGSAQRAMTEIQQALVSRAMHRQRDALKRALSGVAEHGPMTERQALSKQIEDLRAEALYLVPFGSYVPVR